MLKTTALLITLNTANAANGITLNISPESTTPPKFVQTALQCSHITATFSKSTGVGIVYKSQYYLTDFVDIDKLSKTVNEKCNRK